MKKSYLLFGIFLLIFCLSSCRSSETDNKILENLDRIDDTFTVDRSIDPAEYYGDYLFEINYEPTTFEDLKGIYSPDYTFNGDNYYFDVRKKYDKNGRMTGIDMIAYTNLTTGKMYYICADPLCTHSEWDECRYLDLRLNSGIIINGFIYTIRQDYTNDSTTAPYYSLYKIDLDDDSLELVYRCDEDATKKHLIIQGSYDSEVYFMEVNEISDNSEKISKQHNTLCTLNTETGKKDIVGDMPEMYSDISANLIYICNDQFYFKSITGLFVTDYSFENEQTLYSYSANEWISNYFYDTKTNEFIYGIHDDDANTGSIYVYKNGYSEKLTMPHENIYSFQLTNEKIYYSPYDPLYYGVSPRGGEVYDYTGGKIYVTDRDTRAEAELFYEGNKDFALYYGYTVIGNYSYFDYLQLMQEGSNTWFSIALQLKKVRINVAEHTIQYLRFD